MRRHLILDGGRRESIRRVMEDRLQQIADEDAAIIKASPLGQDLTKLEEKHKEMRTRHQKEYDVISKEISKQRGKIRRAFNVTEQHLGDSYKRVQISRKGIARIGRISAIAAELSNRVEFMSPEDALAAFEQFKKEIAKA